MLAVADHINTLSTPSTTIGARAHTQHDWMSSTSQPKLCVLNVMFIVSTQMASLVRLIWLPIKKAPHVNALVCLLHIWMISASEHVTKKAKWGQRALLVGMWLCNLWCLLIFCLRQVSAQTAEQTGPRFFEYTLILVRWNASSAVMMTRQEEPWRSGLDLGNGKCSNIQIVGGGRIWVLEWKTENSNWRGADVLTHAVCKISHSFITPAGCRKVNSFKSDDGEKDWVHRTERDREHWVNREENKQCTSLGSSVKYA